jgi:hypothetical protein
MNICDIFVRLFLFFWEIKNEILSGRAEKITLSEQLENTNSKVKLEQNLAKTDTNQSTIKNDLIFATTKLNMFGKCILKLEKKELKYNKSYKRVFRRKWK